MLHLRSCLLSATAVLLLVVPLTNAQNSSDSAQLKSLLDKMEERIKALEAEVQSLKTQAAANTASPVPVAAAPQTALATPEAPPPSAPQTARLPAAGSYRGNSAMAKVLNPAISLIGKF